MPPATEAFLFGVAAAEGLVQMWNRTDTAQSALTEKAGDWSLASVVPYVVVDIDKTMFIMMMWTMIPFYAACSMEILSGESQKGAITIQRYSVEN